MQENKNIFDYLMQVFVIFGFTILVLNIFCILFGEDAKDFSEIFALGSGGISVKTTFQFLMLSFIIVGIRFVFFTDIFIKKMSIALRTTFMLVLSAGITLVFMYLFKWAPLDMWQPWVMFFVCFGISFAGSCLVVTIKEKLENRHMQEALENFRKKAGN